MDNYYYLYYYYAHYYIVNKILILDFLISLKELEQEEQNGNNEDYDRKFKITAALYKKIFNMKRLEDMIFFD